MRQHFKYMVSTSLITSLSESAPARAEASEGGRSGHSIPGVVKPCGVTAGYAGCSSKAGKGLQSETAQKANSAPPSVSPAPLREALLVSQIQLYKILSGLQ